MNTPAPKLVTAFPDGSNSTVFGGGARELDEASNDFTIAIVLAVAFIYMVLASQFNSLTHPLTRS